MKKLLITTVAVMFASVNAFAASLSDFSFGVSGTALYYDASGTETTKSSGQANDKSDDGGIEMDVVDDESFNRTVIESNSVFSAMEQWSRILDTVDDSKLLEDTATLGFCNNPNQFRAPYEKIMNKLVDGTTTSHKETDCGVSESYVQYLNNAYYKFL